MQFTQPLLRLPTRYCAETLAAEIAALPASAWLPHPGRIPGNDAVPLITPGGEISNAFAGPMAPTEHLRACPYIMDIMADLGAVWGRSRLMGLAPGARVPAHVDVGYYWRTHIRIHIPIVTTPQVRFTCGGESVHMAPGECWVFDSFQMHDVHNGGSQKRIHLVIDTVGGERLWDLIQQAQEEGATPPRNALPPGRARAGSLVFEQVNAPEIMSPWEVICHIAFLLDQAPPADALKPVSRRLDGFVHAWAAAWAQFGPSPAGVPTYQRLMTAVQADLQALRAGSIQLPNEVPLDRALRELIFSVAVPAAARPQPVAVAAPRPNLVGQRLAL